jgi:DNA gyrase subunit A
MERWENDFLEHAFVASTEDTLLFLTTDGRAFGLGVRDVPEAGASSRGKPLRQIFEAARNARVAAVQRVADFRPDRFLLFATAEGTVKRSTLDQYARARSGIEAISLRAGDRVVNARVTDGEHEVVLAASGGRAIRFTEADVPAQGRVSQGVRGMKLKAGETLVGMAAPRHESVLCIVTERGAAKRLPAAELPVQKRDGLGVAVLSVGKTTGSVVGLRDVHAGEDLMAVTAVGRTLRLKTDEVPQLARTDQPRPALTVSAHDRVVEIAPLAEREQAGQPDEDGEEAASTTIVLDEPGEVSSEGATSPEPVAEGEPEPEEQGETPAKPGAEEPPFESGADEPPSEPGADEPPSATELDLFG